MKLSKHFFAHKFHGIKEPPSLTKHIEALMVYERLLRIGEEIPLEPFSELNLETTSKIYSVGSFKEVES